MAAVLSADMDNTDKVVTLIEECRRCGCGRAARGQSLRLPLHGRRSSAPSSTAWAPSKGSARVPSRRSSRGTHADGALPRSLGLLSADRSAQGQPTGPGGPDPRRRTRRAGCQPRDPDGRAALGAQARRAAPCDTQAAGQADLFGASEPVASPEPDPQLATRGPRRLGRPIEQRLAGEKETARALSHRTSDRSLRAELQDPEGAHGLGAARRPHRAHRGHGLRPALRAGA
jgi:DNA polymerase III subunit alpha